jgi:amino-acid N-acetyltransferase
VADLAASAPMFWVAAIEGQIEGLVGLERHGDAGLLRSLAVAFSGRGHGLGTRLVDHVEREAVALGIEELVLLTETAADFFAGLGYRTAGRDAVPQAIRDSAEFRALCPASATCMCKAIR